MSQQTSSVKEANSILGSIPTVGPEIVKKRNSLRWIVSFASVAIFLVAWQLYARSISPLLLVPPTAILSAFKQMASDGELAGAAFASLKVLVTGFSIGFTAAIPIGLLWARFKFVDWTIQPFVSAMFSTPLVALVPLYVLWFGFGFAGKVAIVSSFAFFPVLLNTYQGAISVDPMHLDLARVFKASEWETWRHVVIPSCIPFVVAGLNVSVGHALTGMVISEFYTNATGLGGIVLTASSTFQTAKMFVPIMIIVALGITLMAGTRWMKRKIAPWAANRTGR